MPVCMPGIHAVAPDLDAFLASLQKHDMMGKLEAMLEARKVAAPVKVRLGY